MQIRTDITNRVSILLSADDRVNGSREPLRCSALYGFVSAVFDRHRSSRSETRDGRLAPSLALGGQSPVDLLPGLGTRRFQMVTAPMPRGRHRLSPVLTK